jgi:hypothetical protein
MLKLFYINFSGKKCLENRNQVKVLQHFLLFSESFPKYNFKLLARKSVEFGRVFFY